MKNTEFSLTVKVVSVHCVERNDDPEKEAVNYYYNAYEFPNGVYYIPSHYNVGYFENNKEELVSNSLDPVEYLIDTEKTLQFSRKEILTMIQESFKSYGEQGIPKNHKDLWC